MGKPSPAKVVVDQLIKDLLKRPYDFRCGDIVLKDTKTGIEYWTTNGIFYVGVYKPYEMKFGPIQGWRFLRMLTKWKAVYLIAKCRAQEGCQNALNN